MGSIVEEVCVHFRFHTFEQTIDELVVAAFRNALIAVVEIVVVEDQTHGQTLDDEGWQVCTFTAPLFLGISFYEPLVDVAPDKGQGLLL